MTVFLVRGWTLVCTVVLAMSPIAMAVDKPMPEEKKEAPKKEAPPAAGAKVAPRPAQIVIRRGTRVRMGLPTPTSCPTDPAVSRRLEEARQLLEVGQTDRALELLQSILDLGDNTFLKDEAEPSSPNDAEEDSRRPAPKTPPPPERWIAAHKVVEDFILSAGPQVLDRYRALHRDEAAHLLQEANAQQSPEGWGVVARRFFLTTPGGQALDRLGSHNLDLGRAALAAFYFDRILSSKAHAPRPSAMLSIKRSMARALLGEPDSKSEAPEDDVLVLGGKNVSARQFLDEIRSDLLSDREIVDRDAARRSTDILPLLSPDWESPLTKDANLHALIDEAVETSLGRAVPVVFAHQPMILGDRILFRDLDGNKVLRLQTGQIAPDPPSGSSILQEVSRVDARWYPAMPNQGGVECTFVANQVYGTMTTDGKRVYQINDLSLNPLPVLPQNMRAANDNVADRGRNVITAYDVNTMQVAWTLGASDDNPPAASDANRIFFLGPPKPIGNGLYVLGESRSEISLYSIDAQTGAIAWQEVLAVSAQGIESDIYRRSQWCEVLESDGILICPTNLFHVIAVDPTTRARLWDYSFATDAAIPIQYGMGAQAIMPPQGVGPTDSPCIVGDRVILSEPRSRGIHCLDLRSGQLLWRVERNKDWYLAGVTDNSVLFAGQQQMRALAIADGKELWKSTTPTPSGRGVMAEQLYLLPTADGRVVALEARTGKIVDEVVSRDKQPIGSLTMCNGRALAVGASGLTAYPLMRDVRSEVDRLLSDNPNDPRGLLRRAQLRLAEGDVAPAIEDLRVAVKGGSDPDSSERARVLLFDVAANEALRLADNAGALVVDLEHLARNLPEKGVYYRLLAEHLLRLEDYAGALDASDRHAALGLTTFVPTETEGVVRSPRIWTRSFLRRLVTHAGDRAESEILDRYRKRSKEWLDNGDLDGVLRMVSDLSDLPLGGEVRLELSKRLREKGRFSEAELMLLEAAEGAEPSVAAEAYVTLADGFENAGELVEARYFLSTLAKRWPAARTRSNVNAKQLLDAFDQRHPDSSALHAPVEWQFDKVVAKDEKAFRPDASKRLLFPADPEQPFFRDWLVSFDQQHWQMEFVGRESGAVEWKVGDLPRTLNSQEMRYQQVGDLLFFTQSDSVYAVSGLEKRLIWTRKFEEGSTGEPRMAMASNLRIVVRNSWRSPQSAWPVSSPVGAGFFSVRIGKALHVLDPWTGKDLWIKEGLRPDDIVFGDPEALLVLSQSTGDYIVLRTTDGREVASGSLGQEMRFRKGIIGRRILLFNIGDPRNRRLRLYDPWKNVDYWQKSLPTTTDWLFSDERNIVLFDRDQTITVVDAKSGEVWIQDSIKPKDEKKNANIGLQVQFFSDGGRNYLSLVRHIPGQTQWPVPPSPNLRMTPVNGLLRAYDGQSKKMLWERELLNRAVVTSPGEELPVLVTVGSLMVESGNRKRMATNLEILDKRNGKTLYSQTHDQYGTMLELAYAVGQRWLELRGFQLRIRLDFLKEGEEAKPRQEAGEKEATKDMRSLLDRVRAKREIEKTTEKKP